MSDDPRKGFDSSSNVEYPEHWKRGGPKPPGGNDLEARVDRLERLAEDTRGTLESIQRQLARMDERMHHMPTMEKMYGAMAVMIGLAVAVGAAMLTAFSFIK